VKVTTKSWDERKKSVEGMGEERNGSLKA